MRKNAMKMQTVTMDTAIMEIAFVPRSTTTSMTAQYMAVSLMIIIHILNLTHISYSSKSSVRVMPVISIKFLLL